MPENPETPITLKKRNNKAEVLYDNEDRQIVDSTRFPLVLVAVENVLGPTIFESEFPAYNTSFVPHLRGGGSGGGSRQWGLFDRVHP